MAARDIRSLEAALRRTASLAADLDDPAIRGHQMFSPGLDAAIPAIARRLSLDDVPLVKSNDNACIIVTRVFDVGGHSKVAADIARLIGVERSVMIQTDVENELKQEHLLALRRAPVARRLRAEMFLAARSLSGKILELYNVLAAIRPTRIFLLSHHFDMVAPIALWPFRSVVEYLHHADHLPTLGATLAWSAHVDLTWRCHGVCRQAGLNPIYAGMTVEASPPAKGATSDQTKAKPPGRLRIATCGHVHKYRGFGHARYRWADYVVAALRLPSAELIHFGYADDALQQEVLGAIAQAGLDPAAYVFAGATPNLAADLRAYEVDAYLCSYPESGGKTNLEAMSVGLTPIVPLDPNAPPLIRFDFPLDTWIEVASPDDLPRALADARRRRVAVDGDINPVEAEIRRFQAYIATAPDMRPPQLGA
jgi:hypothetical protein